MTKVPVRETIGVAYRFTFDNFTAIVGLIWLPMLLVLGLDYLQSQIPIDAEAQGANFIRTLAYTLGALLLYAIMYVAVTEQALGLRQGRRYMHIALGITEFRTFGALLVFGILMAFLVLITILGATAVGFVVRSAAGAQIAASVEAVLTLMGIGFLFFCAVRLGFLLVPAVVAERRVSLERSWVLTQGNFWRIFLVNLLLIFPIFLILFFVMVMFVADDFAALRSQYEAGMSAHHPHMMMGMFFLSPFLLGFSMGSAAYAYGVLARRNEMPVPDSLP